MMLRSERKMRRGIGVLTAAALAVAASPCLAQPNEEHEQAAEAAAREWLSLIDTGQYEASWEQSAAAFQAAVSAEVWAAQIERVRAPFDPLGERKLFVAQYTTELPNAPPGEYVVLQFRTETASGGAVVETVTPMREDGAWKVSGYFIAEV